MMYHIPESVYWGTDLHKNEKLKEYSQQMENLFKDNNTMFLTKEQHKEWMTIADKYNKEVYSVLKDNKTLYRRFHYVVKSQDLEYLKSAIKGEPDLENRIIMLYNIRAMDRPNEEYWRKKILESVKGNMSKLFPINDIKSTLIYKIYFIMKTYDKTDIEKIELLLQNIMSRAVDQEKLEQQLYLEYCDNLIDRLFLVPVDIDLQEIKSKVTLHYNKMVMPTWCKFNHEDLFIGNYRMIKLSRDAFSYFVSRRDYTTAVRFLRLFFENIDKALKNKFNAFKTLISHNEDFTLDFLFYLVEYKNFQLEFFGETDIDKYLSPQEKEFVDIGFTDDLKLSRHIAEVYDENHEDVDYNTVWTKEKMHSINNLDEEDIKYIKEILNK